MQRDYKYKVLSIDGGGIRGIIPAKILAEIEKETGKQIHEMFDLIVGTSTGGILALALTKPHPNFPEKAQYSAEELHSLYKKEGKCIFSHTSDSIILNRINYVLEKIQKIFKLSLIDHIVNLFRSKYSANGREKVLNKKFGDTMIKNALTEVFITSYDTELRMPIFFTSNEKRENKEKKSFQNLCEGITMKDAAMATSAAPTYFPPHKIQNQKTNLNKKNPYYSLIDGGVFANNPTTMGIMEAIINSKEPINLSEILVVSLGTGSLKRRYKYDEMKKWGLLQFVRPLINIILDGQSESVACQLDQLLPDANDIPKQYYRFQGDLTHPNDDMDDASSENIKNLEKLAIDILDEKGFFCKYKNPDWHEMCEQLKQPSTESLLKKKNKSDEMCEQLKKPLIKVS